MYVFSVTKILFIFYVYTHVVQNCPYFQIVFVATRRTSFRSDIAIDDVMLYTCPGTVLFDY